MRQAIQWSVLSAYLTVIMAAGAARAQEEKKDTAPTDRGSAEESLYANLREVINHGADLYNSGDWNGCYRLWEGTLMTLKPVLAHRPKLREAIDTGLTNARQDPLLYRRAWVLRSVLDQVRADIKGEAAAGTTEPKDKTSDVTQEPKKKTLWDRLGGEAGVTKIVDDFFNSAAADPKVDFFRGGKYQPSAAEVIKMKRELVEQVSQASGGPLKYTGPDMKKVHKDMGVTNEQYDALIDNIKTALEKHKVADDDKKTILSAANNYRKEIVQPKKPEDKQPLDKKLEDKKPAEKKEDKKPAGTASVEGKVAYQGKPLAGGIIAFVGKKEFVISAPIAADGTYLLNRAEPGDYTVSISDAKGANVPAKYKDAKTSGLAVEIKDGIQTIDLDLK